MLVRHFVSQGAFDKETRDHFEVIAENIHQDVSGANRDEVSLISNKQGEHEHRITALEQARYKQTIPIPCSPRLHCGFGGPARRHVGVALERIA